MPSSLDNTQIPPIKLTWKFWIPKTAIILKTIPQVIQQFDPSSNSIIAPVFREAWADKLARIKAASPYGHLPGWNLQSVIVKASADMRQEQLACHLIQAISQIWDETLGPGQLWTYPLQILVAASKGGLVKTVRDAVSIHSIKKAAYKARVGKPDPFKFSLRDHFIKVGCQKCLHFLIKRPLVVLTADHF